MASFSNMGKMVESVVKKWIEEKVYPVLAIVTKIKNYTCECRVIRNTGEDSGIVLPNVETLTLIGTYGRIMYFIVKNQS